MQIPLTGWDMLFVNLSARFAEVIVISIGPGNVLACRGVLDISSSVQYMP